MRDEGSRSIWRQGTHQTAGPKSGFPDTKMTLATITITYSVFIMRRVLS